MLRRDAFVDEKAFGIGVILVLVNALVDAMPPPMPTSNGKCSCLMALSILCVCVATLVLFVVRFVVYLLTNLLHSLCMTNEVVSWRLRLAMRWRDGALARETAGTTHHA